MSRGQSRGEKFAFFGGEVSFLCVQEVARFLLFSAVTEFLQSLLRLKVNLCVCVLFLFGWANETCLIGFRMLIDSFGMRW